MSIYDPETGYMAISPSGVDYMDTKVEDIVIMKLDGEIIEGDKKPSSEHDLHANIYKKRPDVRAVVHTHSMYCTTFACMNEPIKAYHYLIAGSEAAEIPVVPYATYGSKELATNVLETKADGLAMLLGNHGMVAYGYDLAKAYSVAEQAEWMAELQYKIRSISDGNVLSNEEIAHVIEKFKGYGQVGEEKSGY